MSHQAVIVRLEGVKPHSNAHSLMLADAFGFQVIVGLDAKDGDIGIYFPTELQLSEEFANANDLIRRKNPETGANEGGMFDANRRVRAQKFRGEKSEGFWIPISSLDFIGSGYPEVNTTLDEWNGISICNKYFTPATIRAMNHAQRSIRSNKYFPKHVETEKLKFAIDELKENSVIYITEKIHGTSGRYAFVLDEKTGEKKWWQKVLRRDAKVASEYTHLVGTRNMVLGKSDAKEYYDSEDFRYNAFKPFKDLLAKGEIVYGEIVGYTTTGQPIMGNHDTKELKDIKAAYGNPMTYSYGNAPGFCTFYVYRVCQISEDGMLVELSWPQVKKRAGQLGLNVVPEMHPPFIYDGDKDHLWREIEYLIEGPSILDGSHIREGVVCRVESPDGHIDFYKAKSFSFGVCEGYLKLSEDVIDMEEVS